MFLSCLSVFFFFSFNISICANVKYPVAYCVVRANKDFEKSSNLYICLVTLLQKRCVVRGCLGEWDWRVCLWTCHAYERTTHTYRGQLIFSGPLYVITPRQKIVLPASVRRRADWCHYWRITNVSWCQPVKLSVAGARDVTDNIQLRLPCLCSHTQN